MTKFMWSLKISGYDDNYRHRVLDGILNKLEQNEKAIQEGSRHRFRKGHNILLEKSDRLGKFPNTLFLTNSVVKTIKVSATPNAGLANVIH